MSTLHVVALPHTTTTKEYLPCAYTQKVLNFCRMMTGAGWNVVHYGTEGSEIEGEHITIITRKEQSKLFGDYDFRKTFFKIDWNSKLPYWQLHNQRAAENIRRRHKPGDFLCLIAGNCQQPLAVDLQDLGMKVVEWGIGYAGVFAPFRVFESYAWMHCLLGGTTGGAYAADGRFYDEVIPNSFPREDFSLGASGKKRDYAFFIGRLVRRKGVQAAVEACVAADIPLKIAGQGGEMKGDRLHYDGMSVHAPNVEYVGVVDVKQRNELMGGAIATLVPTFYVEPFGGVAVESQMCGTPAITTPWGAFIETVEHGKTGFHCRTMGQFVWALRKCRDMRAADRKYIRERALAKYSLEAVQPLYDAYFKRLQELDGKGWYTVRDTPEV